MIFLFTFVIGSVDLERRLLSSVAPKQWQEASQTVVVMLSLFLLLGVKEIDIAATLEHIRDQRPGLVRTKVLSISARVFGLFEHF